MDTEPPSNDYARSKSTKFRFKSSSSKHHESTHSRHRHSSHRHKSKHSRHRHRSASPTTDTPSETHLNTDTAFRESLFDALGDDEGAAYWESVYGQPIHTYPIPNVPKGPNGELEQMSEEEYASYVRTRMWERTREGMEEERERLRAERAKQKRREARAEEERGEFERAVEESLARGRERKRE
ncbi:hypothetical protein BBP40_007089, partial [Aspergillus hancockii]